MMLKWFVGLFRNEEGANMVEYGLIAALIAVVIIGVITLLGEELEGMFGGIKDAIQDADPDYDNGG